MLSADEEDVAAVLGGDVERFEGIVRRWQRPLAKLAFRYIHDEARAEEFAQEAFIKCFRSLKQWRREAQFSTWLFSVAISVYRSKLRRFEPVREAVDETMRDPAPPADHRLAEAGQAESVRRAVHTLPLLYREPLLLFYFQEQNLAETARLLGLPEGTVKARLHRARETLRNVLAKEFS